MISNTTRIKKYVDKVAFYGEISIDIVQTKERELKLDFTNGLIDEEWYFAVEFGARYFFEHYRKTREDGLFISVKRLHTMLVDSSSAVVFFITVECLRDTLRINKRLIDFNEVTGEFTIYK